MAREMGLQCATCGRQTLHRQQGPNHMLHLLLTFVTCTLWAVVWLFLTIRATDEPWLCTTCGTARLPQEPLRAAGPARPLTQEEVQAAWKRTRRALLALGAAVLAVLLLALGLELAIDGPAGFLRLIHRTLGI